MITIQCTTPNCGATIESLRPIENFKCQGCSGNVRQFQTMSHDPALGTPKRKIKNDRYELAKLTEGNFRGFSVESIDRESRNSPSWANSPEGVQRILLTAFPRLHSDPNQRIRAARWAQIIHLYFQLGWPDAVVAEALNMKVNAVKMICRTIVYTSQGRNKHGRLRIRKGTLI